MATYKITAPDGQSYNVNAPDGASESEVMAYAQRNFKMLAKDKKPETTLAEDVLQGGKNAIGGFIRGAGSIGATFAMPFETGTENEARRARIDTNMADLVGADPNSWMYKGFKLGGEIAGTAGAGGAIAKPVAAFAPKLAQAIATSGFSLGGAPAASTVAGRAADMGLRMAGGAITGGASAGMVGDSVGMGAAIGGALPPALKGVGMAGGAVVRGVKSALTPAQQAMAVKVAKMTGKSVDEVLAAVNAQEPSILNIKKTVPQILQDDGVSQLQRSAINSGDKSIMAREAAQNLERLAGFDRVAPVMGTVNEAADNAGNLIGDFANSNRAAESRRVSRIFDSIDPFSETSIELPLDAMAASKAKFLGAGTFGKGNEAARALEVAQDVGTELVKPIKPMTQRAAGKSQSLEQAVRSAGGIRGGAGELRDLGIKQSGTTGIVNNKTGKAADLLAEDMYRRGFLPDSDPATLFDMLRNNQGRKVFASDATEGGMQAMLERSMGDIPDEALRVMKPVPFETVQNIRGSLNEAWRDASMGGRKQEAAALKGMIANIDDKVKAVASGVRNQNEAFPADIAETWRDALAAQAAKKRRFDTGPQAMIGRMGNDGQAAIQGAEIPGKFFSSRASQIEDAQAFKRLTKNDEAMNRALKSYAVTDASNQVTANGMLSNAKLGKWMDSRSGALGEVMTPKDMALLNEIRGGVAGADSAMRRGIGPGSNTVQNAEAAAQFLGNGLLDSKLFNLAAAKLPGGGFGLDAIRRGASAGKAERLGSLLADPEVFSAELQKYLARNKPGKVSGLLSSPASLGLQQLGYRSAPLLMSGQ
jgi:hypothetical protein